MADHAEPARKPVDTGIAAHAEKATAHEDGHYHALLNGRPEGAFIIDHARALNARPAVAAQRKAAEALARPNRTAPHPAAPPNRTGLPDSLKQGIESLSDLSMDDVRVHRDSAEPAKLGALAYAKGSDIHLGPGQERHLPHEAWHVVQQKQGRVRPVRQLKHAQINDDLALEREAHTMGEKSARVTVADASHPKQEGAPPARAKQTATSVILPVQRVPAVQQPTQYTCWATAGFSIHSHFGGPALTIQEFVEDYGTLNSIVSFINDQVCDIDEVIGQASSDNRLTGSDTVPPFLKTDITNSLTNATPIVANVNGDHYIVFQSATIAIVGNVLRITYMDPATGANVVADAVDDPNDAQRVTQVGNYLLSVLYYTD